MVTATKELHDEENVAKQVASQGRMEFKLNDEAFNKLQKKVIEELVAKLKLLERKMSLLSKENSLQSCVIMQLKKYHSTKSKMVQHCDRGHLFCKKINTRYNFVAEHFLSCLANIFWSRPYHTLQSRVYARALLFC